VHVAESLGEACDLDHRGHAVPSFSIISVN